VIYPGYRARYTPYQIATLAQLRRLSETPSDWDSHFVLTADIDAADTAGWNGGEGFSPIGEPGNPFTGSLDGSGKVISRLAIDRPTRTYAGLFGWLSDTASLSGVGLVDADVVALDWVGILAGYNAGSVTGCFAAGSVDGSAFVASLGGLVGENAGAIATSHARATVTASDSESRSGGLVGYNLGSITSSYAVGEVGGNGSSFEAIGGLVGLNGLAGVITTGHAMGSIRGAGNVGGLVGRNVGAIDGGLAVVAVDGGSSGSGGGLIGEQSSSGTVNVGYWDTDVATGVAGDTGTGDATGITGLTTDAMTRAASFAGLDFPTDWLIVEGLTRPYLSWQEVPAAVRYAAGMGTTADPYQIASLFELRRLSETPADWSSHFVLTADIDAGDTARWDATRGLSPIGSNDGQLAFRGSFDGDGHAITGMTVKRPAAAVGLFGYLGDEASVHDLALEDVSNASDSNFAGGLAGLVRGRIERCSVSGHISGFRDVGGLAGRVLANGAVIASRADVDVSASGNVGGLVGTLDETAEVTRSHAAGEARGGFTVGGLVGSNSGRVDLSYASAAVSGDGDVGGLVGFNVGTVSTSHAVGPVSGNGAVGGLIGSNGLTPRPVVTDTYWDRDRSGTDDGIGNDPADTGATGLSGEEALQQASYAAFDFINDWRIAEGATHPFLTGEQTPTAVAFSAGSGTEADPYLIRSLAELRLLSEPPASAFWQFHYALEADIDASETATWNGGRGFSPIGSWVTNEPFSRSFDGRGHTIAGLTIDRPMDDAVGLFAILRGPGARVSNLRLDQAMIRGSFAVGALVGQLGSESFTLPGEVADCSVTGSVSGNMRVGGLVGNSEVSTIRSSSVSANVTGNLDVGGLVGRSLDSDITSSHAKGRVSGSERVGGLVGTLANGSLIESYSMADVLGGDRIGGLVAENTRGGSISACFATGDVTGAVEAGGLFGLNSGRVSDSYALGRVSGTDNVGGLGGRNSYFWPVTATYAAGRVTGDSEVGGLIGFTVGSAADYVTDAYWETDSAGTGIGIGDEPASSAATGLDAAAMVRQASFAGFDFAATWDIVEGLTRPFLQWQAALDVLGPPPAPMILDSFAGDGYIALRLAASDDPAVVGYRATCRDAAGTAFTGLGGPVSVVVTGLVNGVDYACDVVAIDASAEVSDPSPPTGTLTPANIARVLVPVLQLLLDD
jgi:hypothetical protein